MTSYARMRIFGAAAGFAAITSVAGAASLTASAQEAPVGQVRVVHAIQGLVADVYVDGNLTLQAFKPQRTTAPLPVPVGDHRIELRKAQAPATSTPLLAANVTVPEGFIGSLVAHLDAKNAPTLSAYVDDLSPIPAGQSRIVVRHTAATAAVDVRLNDDIAIGRLQSGSSSGTLVNAGAYQATVTKSGAKKQLVPPQSVEFPDGTANFVYLIGSEKDDTLAWIAVQIDGLGTAPQAIQTGDGSTRPHSNGPEVPLMLAAIAIVGSSIAFWRLRTRRAVA